MSSDSSDEDERLQQLKEACDSQFINDSMFKKDENSESQAKEKLPSLRRCKDEDEQFNLFRVTPEFRNHVAKHLTRLLDEKIKYKSKQDRKNHKRKSGGVKLLRNSPNFIELAINSEYNHRINNKKNVEPQNEELQYEKCKSVAVSCDTVLNKTDTKSWSNRTKATIFKYKQTNTGLVEIT